jgi:hypothetical protein
MDLHTLVEIITGVVGFGGFIVTIMIRNTQSEVKAELTKQINTTATALAVHSAIDEEKFHSIGAQLSRIEEKINSFGN